MVLATTVSGMGTHMLESILQTRCTDLEFTVLQTGIDMKDHGMKEEDKGLVLYTFRNGESQSGHWQNGILDIMSSHSVTHPVSPVAVYHSRVLNVVREARRAAEKAYDLAKVDERVNKAVAAANRSSNAARVGAVKAVQKQLPNRLLTC